LTHKARKNILFSPLCRRGDKTYQKWMAFFIFQRAYHHIADRHRRWYGKIYISFTSAASPKGTYKIMVELERLFALSRHKNIKYKDRKYV